MKLDEKFLVQKAFQEMWMFVWRKIWVLVAMGALVGPVQATPPVKEKAATGAVVTRSNSGKGSHAVARTAKRAEGGRSQAAAKGMAPVTVRMRPAKTEVVPPPSAREPILLPVAIEDQAASARPTKAVPMRVYALDSNSFYQNGQLVRIQGLPDLVVGGEHAKQRLQQMLDSGVVTVLPVGNGARGEMMAEVRVNGRNVAEAMSHQN